MCFAAAARQIQNPVLSLHPARHNQRRCCCNSEGKTCRCGRDYLRLQALTFFVGSIASVRQIAPRRAGGMLIAISSPYRKAGLMFNKWKVAFGKDDPRVLVVRAPSALLNPTVDQAGIDAALADDPEAAKSEWMAEWRSDLASFLDDRSIDDAIDNARPLELPPRDGYFKYHCFVDMSGGRSDFSTCCVSHAEGERIVIDAIRGRAGDPAAATQEFCNLATAYGCDQIVGDNYGADLVAGPYRERGMTYTVSSLVRSEIYLATLAIWTRGLVSMPDHPAAIRELRMLERKVARSGRDSVNHPPGQHDDHANALCGAIYLAAAEGSNRFEPAFVSVPWGGPHGRHRK
jgi:hypothetical protein